MFVRASMGILVMSYEEEIDTISALAFQLEFALVPCEFLTIHPLY